jgi:glucose/arabinose dehydrogenase
MLARLLGIGMLVGLLAPAAATAGVKATPVASVTAPTYIVSPPGDTHRLLVVQQNGRITLLKDGVMQPTPFLDIAARVTVNGEQGLLSMAFAPDYATSRRFYVYYTSTTCPDQPGCDEHVSEFTAAASGDNANRSTEQLLLTIPHPHQSNHNGGQLQFGPDGDLYISVGDGGGGDDTEQNAQHTDRLLGKILRIAPGTTSYSIPAGNPFALEPRCSTAGHPGTSCPEIWAYGLRNPWRFSFDSATGDIVVGDVGQNAAEEIDYARRGQNAGANYGWPCLEGTALDAPAPASECKPLPTNTVAPVLTYPHPANCASAPFCGAGIIGGYVMHDPRMPSLNGCYVFGDLSTPALRVVRLAQPTALGAAPLGAQIASLSSFGQDAAGHVYAADVASGVVYRLDPDGNPATNPTCPPPSGYPAAPPVTPKPTAGNAPGEPSGTSRHRRPSARKLSALTLSPAAFREVRSQRAAELAARDARQLSPDRARHRDVHCAARSLRPPRLARRTGQLSRHPQARNPGYGSPAALAATPCPAAATGWWPEPTSARARCRRRCGLGFGSVSEPGQAASSSGGTSRGRWITCSSSAGLRLRLSAGPEAKLVGSPHRGHIPASPTNEYELPQKQTTSIICVTPICCFRLTVERRAGISS